MRVDNVERACGDYFANAGAFGVQPRCYWINSKMMTIALGPQWTAPLTLNVGPGVAAGLFATLSGSAPNPATPIALAIAQLPMSPTVVIAGPSQITLCDTRAVFDGRGSLGAAVTSVNNLPLWRWSVVSGVSTASLTAAIAAATGSNSPVLSVSPIDFAPGANVTIQLAITTIGGITTAVNRHSFMMNTSPLVDVTIVSPSSLTIFASDELILRALVAPGLTPTCSPLSPGIYSWAWTKVSGPNSVNLDHRTQVTSTYRIPPNTLTGYTTTDPLGATYVFQCAVSLNDVLQTVGRAFVTVRVLRSPLVALPFGQQLDTRLLDVVINAGAQSEDADFTPVTPSFQWDCQEVLYPARACVVSSITGAAPATPQGLLNFSGTNLQPGDWEFRSIFTKGGRSARATRTVTMDWDDSPAGFVIVVDPARLQFPAVGNRARQRMLVNARQPLVLKGSHVRVRGDSVLSQWHWSCPSGAVDLQAVAQGVNGAYLFIPPNTLVPGRAYEFLAVATDSKGRSSSLLFSFTVNDEPRWEAPNGGCQLDASTPASVNALSTVITVNCQGFTDDSTHYPLGYNLYTNPTGFALFTGFSQSSSLQFVLQDGVTSLAFAAQDSQSSVTLPFLLGAPTTVVAAFPSNGNADGVVAAAGRWVCTSRDPSCFDGSLQAVVDVGLVERIDQVAYGIMRGITQPGVVYNDVQLEALRGYWLEVEGLLDKFFVVMPSHLWATNEGVKQQAATRLPLLLNPSMQLVTVLKMGTTFRMYAPNTKLIAEAHVPVLSNVVSSMEASSSLLDQVATQERVSYEWVERVWTLLLHQVVGGAAVGHSTVAARYGVDRLGVVARNDTFSDVSYVASSPNVALSLTVAHPASDRTHWINLSDEAVVIIEAASGAAHGLLAFAVDYDLFEWSQLPRLSLVSDVVGFRATSQFAPLWQPIQEAGGSIISLQITPALLAAQPANTSLSCARWDYSVKQWSLDGILNQTNMLPSRVECTIDRFGIFALVWAPILADGGVGPLLPLGPKPGFVVPWLPLVVLLILLLLLGLLLALYFCFRFGAPPFVAPESAAEPVVALEPLDDWSTHLKRPNRKHIPGEMPPDHAVIYFDDTTSGVDNWPSDDQPDMVAIAPPLYPPRERAPFVGGRVAMLRENAQVVDADQGVVVAPTQNAFDIYARRAPSDDDDDDDDLDYEFSSDSRGGDGRGLLK